MRRWINVVGEWLQIVLPVDALGIFLSAVCRTANSSASLSERLNSGTTSYTVTPTIICLCMQSQPSRISK